jgi:hypothetical protein
MIHGLLRDLISSARKLKMSALIEGMCNQKLAPSATDKYSEFRLVIYSFLVLEVFKPY